MWPATRPCRRSCCRKRCRSRSHRSLGYRRSRSRCTCRRRNRRDVYLDGGELIRQALDAALVDELVVTLIPVVLGSGHPLFAGAQQRHRFELLANATLPGGLVQLTFRPLTQG